MRASDYCPLSEAVRGILEASHSNVLVYAACEAVRSPCNDHHVLSSKYGGTWIVNDDRFRSMLRPTEWSSLLSRCLEKLMNETEWESLSKEEFFQFSAASCLAKSTVSCILPQSREAIVEQDEMLLTMNSLEQILIKSKLSEDAHAQQQFSKVKDGMESFCGVKLDVKQKRAEVQSRKEEGKEVRALGKALATLSKINHPLTRTIMQELGRKAPSWSGDLRVMVTRTISNEDATYSYKTSLSGLSGGEVEIMMVLCAIHLSEADTVFLDEPGHSLHPPQQAQLSRWIETLQHPDPVCVVVTHSVEFISRKSLNSLYHMSFTGKGFTSFKLSVHSQAEGKRTSSGGKSMTAAPLAAPSASPDDVSKDEAVTSAEQHSAALSEESPVPHGGTPPPDDAFVAEGTMKGEHHCAPSHKSFGFSATSPFATLLSCPDDVAEDEETVSAAPSTVSPDVTLSEGIVNMLMRPDMRKMFFASGLYFVEGETDKLVLTAVRHLLLKDAHDSKERYKEVNREVLEMDQWDILALGGCAEAVKAYRAAAELRIPCAIVLDLDTITVKHGTRVQPFNSKNWKSSRLYKELTKERQRNSLRDAALLLDKVDAVFQEGRRTQEEALGETRKIFQEHGIWIWEGDLESVVCDNPAARQQLRTSECFMEALGEHPFVYLAVRVRGKMPTKDALDNYDSRVLAPLVPLVDELRAELDAARARLCENPSQRVTEDMQQIIVKIGKYRQPLKKHDDFCEMGTKRTVVSLPSHKHSSEETVGDPSQEIQSHQDAVSMTPSVADAQEPGHEKIMWDRIKHKLHNEGGWAKLPWDTLCKVVEVCLEAESSPLQDFCRFMYKWQSRGKRKEKAPDPPPSLLSKLFSPPEKVPERQ